MLAPAIRGLVLHEGDGTVSHDASLAGRIAAEYREMPGMALTLGQAARLWCLDQVRAAQVLEHLEKEGVLRQNASGRYLLRASGGS